MTLNLKYYSSNIIDYKPSAKQWWITGFNSNYDNKNRDTLTASYSMTFSTRSYSCSFDEKMYNSFKQKWNGKTGQNSGKYWSFSSNKQFSFSFLGVKR